MSVNNYKKMQDDYWKVSKQKPVFRHKTAIDFIKNGQVLDVGCGDGLLLELLKQKGVTALGIDLSEQAVKTATGKGLDVKQADVLAGQLPYKDNSFDYVVALDVLEHTFMPEKFLQEMKRISKKYLIVGVPNFSSLAARLQVFRGLVPENNISRKNHAYWFNYEILNKLIKEAGLTIVDYKVNSFYSSVPLLGKLFEQLAKKIPSLFALSFVVLIENNYE